MYIGPVGPKLETENHHKTIEIELYEAQILSTPQLKTKNTSGGILSEANLERLLRHL